MTKIKENTLLWIYRIFVVLILLGNMWSIFATNQNMENSFHDNLSVMTTLNNDQNKILGIIENINMPNEVTTNCAPQEFNLHTQEYIDFMTAIEPVLQNNPTAIQFVEIMIAAQSNNQAVASMILDRILPLPNK